MLNTLSALEMLHDSVLRESTTGIAADVRLLRLSERVKQNFHRFFAAEQRLSGDPADAVNLPAV